MLHLKKLGLASLMAWITPVTALAQLVNNGWEFLQPLGATVYLDENAWPCVAVGAMVNWDPDGPGPHAGFIVVSGSFYYTRAEGALDEIALIDVTGGDWLPLGTSHDVYARHLSVQVEPDGKQSLFALGAIRPTGSGIQQSVRAGLLQQGQWTFFGPGTYGLHSLPPDVMTWTLDGQRFIVAAHSGSLPEFYNGESWAPFGVGPASFIPRLTLNWTKMMQAVPQANGGFHLVHAGDGYFRYTGEATWERMGNVVPIHGAKSFLQPRADGGADLIAGIEMRPPHGSRFGVGRWDGNTWELLAPDASFQQIIPYPNPTGSFNVLVTDDLGVYADGGLISGPALWDGSAWQSLRYPGTAYEISRVVLGPGAPGQQDIYVGGNLRDPLTGDRAVVARLRWQNIRPSRCFLTDFNRNGISPEAADVTAFFDAVSGSCPHSNCASIDFNRNGVYPEQQDIVDFITAYATTCSPN